MMPLHREIAAAKGEALGLAPYDALMDEVDPGLSTALVDPIFNDLETSLPGILAEAVERQSAWPDPIPFSGDFSPDRQRILSYRLLEAVGHSSENCRIDSPPHPFALAGSPGDNRFTTRFDDDNIRFAIMATLHEAGHALYEANLPRELAFTPVGAARGATAHESQSITVGETFAAQLFERASAQDPSISVRLGQGDFAPYRAWVGPRIHHRASQVPFAALVEEATGAPLSAAALKRHLRRRYIEEAGPA